jgi:hypothetical protein
MKKLFTFILFSSLFFYGGKVSSQVNYDKGNILVNGGIGLGYYYSHGGIPILLSGEYALTDAITVGPYLGYTSRAYTNSSFGYKWKYRYTFLDFGARGSYHFGKHLNLNMDKLDLYGGVFLGYLSAHYKVVEAPSGLGAGYYNSYSSPYGSIVRVGIFGGARYYFSDQVAAYGELGYGIAPLALGLTVKF